MPGGFRWSLWNNMKILTIESLAIPDVKVIRYQRFTDLRGYFTETYRRSDLAALPELSSLGEATFGQCNESYSRAGVVRGLHFQWNPHMGKLVRTVLGRMIDLVLDIRCGSPTAGKIIGYELPAAPASTEGVWIWVPPGFAHGNVFSEPTTIEYLCTGQYSPGCEGCISPLSADLDWSLCDRALREEFERLVASGPILTDKDRDGMTHHAWMADSRSENFRHGRC